MKMRCEGEVGSMLTTNTAKNEKRKETLSGCEFLFMGVSDITKRLIVPDHYPKFREDILERLCRNIKRNGILQPILLKREKGKFILVDGWKRLMCAIENKISPIPVVICDEYSPELKDAVTLTLNIARSRPCGYEVVLAVYNLYTAGVTYKQIEEAIGLTAKTIKNYITAGNNYVKKVVENATEEQLKAINEKMRELCLSTSRFINCSTIATDPESFLKCIISMPRDAEPLKEGLKKAKAKEILKEAMDKGLSDLQLKEAIDLYRIIKDSKTFEELCQKLKEYLGV